MKLKNLPNTISIIRILMVPLFIALFFSGIDNAKLWAAGVYIAAAVTDALDGAIARKYQLTSTLGKVLDPLGDKLINAAAVLCMSISGIIPYWPIIIFLIKEVMMAVGALLLYRVRSDVFPSNKLGKVSTVVLFLVCAALMVFPAIPSHIAGAMITFAIGLTVITLFVYFTTFISLMKQSNK